MGEPHPDSAGRTGPGARISPVKILDTRIDPNPTLIFATGYVAIALVVMLWLAGFDAGAAKMMLGSLLFAMVCFDCYLVDPRGGRNSFARGAFVGGATVLVGLPCVVCKYSYETRGIPLPNSPFEAAMLGIALLFLIPFGIAVGGMTGVIGGRILRAAGSLIRSALARDGRKGEGKRPRDPVMDELFGPGPGSR